jgi:hypothetical protein
VYNRTHTQQKACSKISCVYFKRGLKMAKLNFTVEAEINAQWVHANVATLSEAVVVLNAFEAQDAVDASIHINKDATDAAKAEFKQYTLDQAANAFKWLNDLVAQNKAALDNGVYTINANNI